MLKPYRVLDFTDNRAALGPMILRDLGADVVKVEPLDGAAARRQGPLVPGAVDGMASIPFAVHNRGKRSVMLDFESADGRTQFLDLVRGTDFLFENEEPGAMAAAGLGYDDLLKVNPSLIYVAVSPFGQDGPYANHRSTDLTLAAMSGMAAVNGEPDRAPVRMSIDQTWYHAGAASAAGALAALHRRIATGEGQFVDVSVQASAIWTTIQAMVAFGVQGSNFVRAGTDLQLGMLTLPIVFQAADGEVVLVPTGATVGPMANWMADDGIVSEEWVQAEDWKTYDLRWLTGQPVVHGVAEVSGYLRKYLSGRTKEELLERGLQESVTVVPVAKVDEVLGFRHLSERGYWQPLALGDGSTVRAPGAFVRAAGTPLKSPGKVAVPGEHTAEVLAEKRTQSALPSSGTTRLPFEGLKVADFSWIGVGPLTAKYFADHGATVVRVETTNPPDRLRGASPMKDGVSGVNRSHFFAMANPSKKGIVLNLKEPAGQAVAKKLLAWCDLAIESFTPGTMKDLGLDYEVARKLNPSIIMASSCLMGQTGPAARLAGYGYHAAAICGFYEVTGWADRSPAGPFTAYTDIIAPSFLATTIAAALDHRRRTGEGQYIEQAQMESSLYFLAEQLVDHQVNGTVPRRMGNAHPSMAPHGIYPALGDDRWIAIACEDDAQWEALRGVRGSPSGFDDPSFATAAGRLGRREELDARIATWTAAEDPDALMGRLQAAGVPAGVAQRSSELLADPQLAHRHFFRTLHHSEIGDDPYEGHQYTIRGYDNGPRFAAPCLGEHTFEVLTELLGMSQDEAVEAMATGAVGV